MEKNLNVLKQIAGLVNDVNSLTIALEEIKETNGKELYPSTLMDLMATLGSAVKGLSGITSDFNHLVVMAKYSKKTEMIEQF